jgi:hypothetical protein
MLHGPNLLATTNFLLLLLNYLSGLGISVDLDELDDIETKPVVQETAVLTFK